MKPHRISPFRGAGVALVVALGTLASVSSLGAQQTPPMQKVERRFAAASDVSLRVYGEFTSLRVVGWEHDSVVVTGGVPKGARFEAAVGPGPGVARGAKMFIEGTIEGVPVAGGRLELRVPRRARVWAKSGSANIEVGGVTGGIDLNIVGGSVRVSDRPRELNIESMDGDVRIDGGAEWLRAKTATGRIELRGGSEDARVSSVSGAVRVEAGRYDRGTFETVTGEIVYGGELARGASLDFNTHSGNIDLRLPGRGSVEFDGLTITGTIENAFTQNRPVRGREGRGMELTFEQALGESRVVARSFKGNIVLRQR